MTLPHAPTVDDLLADAEERLHLDPAAAEKVLAEVVERAAELGLSTQAGQAHYLLARVLAERGDLDDAVGHIAEARRLFELAGEPLRAARTDLGRMQILDDLGRHAEALQVGEALLAVLPGIAAESDEDQRVKDLITAAAWGNCGVACGYLGLHRRSLSAYELAEQGYAALGMEVESAQWQANRGVELLSLGEADAAAVALADAAAGFQADGDLLWAAKCEGDLAQADHLRGDLVGALARLDRAQDTLRRLGADAELARVLLQRGQSYLDAGLWRESKVASGEAATIARSAGMRHDLAHAHLLAARAAIAGGSLGAGERELAVAVDLFHEVGDSQFSARSQLVAAELMLRRDAQDEGTAALEATVDRLTEGGWQIPAAHGMLALHDSAVLPEEKAAWLDRADRIATEIGHPTLSTAVRLRQAQARRAAGDDHAAADLLRETVQKIEELGSALSEPLLATAFRTAKRPVFDELVHVLACSSDPGAPAQALAVSDRAKAHTLEDLVGVTVGRRSARFVNGSTERDRAVADHRRDLSAVYAAIHEATDPDLATLLRDRARDLESRLGDLLVRRHLPESAAPRHGAPGTAIDSGLRQPGLAFHVVASDIVAFVVDGSEVRCTVMRGAYDQVRVLVGQLSAQWGRFRMGRRLDLRQHDAQLVATTRAVLCDLYDALLRPLDLPATDGAPLVVSPDRLLHRIPFHALHDGTAYLLERGPVVLAPTTLPPSPSPDPTATQRLLVAGVPDDRAPGITGEVALVAAAHPESTVLLGDAATVAAVAEASASATHLHLACHGMYREENPLFSSLRFADRWATISEVLELDLTDTAVTLSACESGRADDTAEPVGMAWGFLAAGARSVVVSQWVLDDESASELMAAYHAGLAGGLAAEAALHRAQLDAMHRRPHPYHWAPFVHVSSPFAAGSVTGVDHHA